MQMVGRRRSSKAPILPDLDRVEIGQEVIAGVMGWQTVVTSLESCEYRIHRVISWLVMRSVDFAYLS